MRAEATRRDRCVDRQTVADVAWVTVTNSTHTFASRALWGVTAALLLAGASGLTANAANQPDDISALKASYEKCFEKVDIAHSAKIETWRQEYRRVLLALKEQTQAAAQLDAVIAVREEMDRLERDGDLTEDDVLSEPQALVELQTVYLSALAKIGFEKSETTLALWNKYDGWLESQERKLTREGKIDAALALRKERQRARNDSRITAAKFNVTAHEVERQESEEGSPPAIDMEASSPPDLQPSEPLRDLPRGVTLHTGSKPPRSPVESLFKPLSLNRTGHSPLGKGLSVSPEMARDNETKREGGRHHKIERIRDQWYLRIALKMMPAHDVLEQATLVVQYFSKDATARGRIDPILKSIKRVPLQKVDTSTTCVVFPPVETAFRKEKIGRNPWRDTGSELYGVLISIYNADGSLAFQGASVRGLNDEASATLLPESKEEQLVNIQEEFAGVSQRFIEARDAHVLNPGDATLQAAYQKALAERNRAWIELEAKKRQVEAQSP